MTSVSGDVVISWAERDALLDELVPLKDAASIVCAFEAVGSSRPVILEADERRRVLVALSFLRAGDTERDLTAMACLSWGLAGIRVLRHLAIAQRMNLRGQTILADGPAAMQRLFATAAQGGVPS